MSLRVAVPRQGRNVTLDSYDVIKFTTVSKDGKKTTRYRIQGESEKEEAKAGGLRTFSKFVSEADAKKLKAGSRTGKYKDEGEKRLGERKTRKTCKEKYDECLAKEKPKRKPKKKSPVKKPSAAKKPKKKSPVKKPSAAKKPKKKSPAKKPKKAGRPKKK